MKVLRIRSRKAPSNEQNEAASFEMWGLQRKTAADRQGAKPPNRPPFFLSGKRSTLFSIFRVTRGEA